MNELQEFLLQAYKDHEKDQNATIDFSDYWDVEASLDIAGEEVDEIDYDEHRWYIASVKVFKIKDKYIGIGHWNCKSEQNSLEDLCIDSPEDIFEMKQIQTVSYTYK